MRIFEDQRRRLGMAPGRLGCDRRAQPDPVEDDRGRGQMTRVGEVAPGGVGILVGACFRGMDVHALSKAAIIEGKNIHAEVVQGLQLRQRVREGAGAVMQEEQGVGGIGAWRSAGIHQPLSWRMPVSVASNRISSYFRPTEAGVAVMVRDGLKTSCHWPCQKSRQKVTYTQSAAKSRVAATPPRIQRALASGCCGASGFFHPGGGVCFAGRFVCAGSALHG